MPKKLYGKYKVSVYIRGKDKRFRKKEEYWTDKMPDRRPTKNKRIVVSQTKRY